MTERAGNLSGGQQQLLAIAMAMMSRPKLLLMDEPSLGLSPNFVNKVFDKIIELKESGDLSVLFVEQNAKKALEIADSTYVLESGKIVLHGGSELLKKPQIKKVYLGGA